jgi:hypothetical protein
MPAPEPGIDEPRPRTLTLDDLTVTMLRALGGGNASRGARVAARVAYRIYQATPDEPAEGETK